VQRKTTPMDSLTFRAAIARTHELESEIAELRRQIELEALGPADSQYLSRCFDLLAMELLALRQFITRLTNE